MVRQIIILIITITFFTSAEDNLQQYNLQKDCDRPLGAQITAGGLLVLCGLFCIAGYQANKLSKDIEKEVNTTGNYQPYGVYSLLGNFAYVLGGVSFSASVVLEIKSIKEWKLYKKCRNN